MSGLQYLSTLSVLFPLIAILIVRKYISTRKQKIIVAYFCLCPISEIVNLSLAITIRSNILSGNIFILIEFCFWCWLLFDLLKDKISLWILFLVIGAMIFQWINHLIIYQAAKHNALFSMLQASIIMIASGYYLLLLSKKSTVVLYKVPEFWFVTGALMYFSFSLISLGIPQYLMIRHPSDALQRFVRMFWDFYSIFNILANIIYSKGFLCFRSTKKI
jgi:hypothetical protein